MVCVCTAGVWHFATPAVSPFCVLCLPHLVFNAPLALCCHAHALPLPTTPACPRAAPPTFLPAHPFKLISLVAFVGPCGRFTPNAPLPSGYHTLLVVVQFIWTLHTFAAGLPAHPHAPHYTHCFSAHLHAYATMSVRFLGRKLPAPVTTRATRQLVLSGRFLPPAGTGGWFAVHL